MFGLKIFKGKFNKYKTKNLEVKNKSERRRFNKSNPTLQPEKIS